MEKKIYQRLAKLISWNSPKDPKWVDARDEEIEAIMKTAPHGSGIDGDVTLIENDSSDTEIVIKAQYHTMNQNGYYGEWITAIITITATLVTPGFDIDVQFEEDIEKINNQYYNEAVKYVNKEYPGLKGYDREDKISECADYIDEDGIAEYITECFYDWFMSDYKEVK